MFSFFCCSQKKPTPPKNDPKPPVHVLMPLYNANEFVLDSIRSILIQDYPNLKIFIYDDGSTDGSLQKVQLLVKQLGIPESKIQIQAAEQNRGISKTRKDLFHWSRSVSPHAYTFWLDSDDQYIDPHFISKTITQMLATKADICLFNFKIKFEDESQQNNAAVLMKDKERIAGILKAITTTSTQSIHPTQCANLLQFSSLGWTKCYGPTVALPVPANCPYEDFVYMAALLQANTITALPAENEPLEYLRRSTSICGQRKHDNFAVHIPMQLYKFFLTVLENTAKQEDQLTKLKMAQEFVADKFTQYAKMLAQFVEKKSHAGIDEKTQEEFLRQAAAINKDIQEEMEIVRDAFNRPLEQRRMSVTM